MKWGDLPYELSALVLDHLPVGDRVRFGAVCTSWRSAAAAAAEAAENGRRPTTPESPWLMIKDDNDKDKDYVKFFSITEWRSYRLHLPQFGENRYICSSDGWLVFAESLAELSLINPLTGTVARLPTLPTPGGAQGVLRDPVRGRITGYYCKIDDHLTLSEAFNYRFDDNKVVFFPSSSVALAAVVPYPYPLVFSTGSLRDLHFARIGGDSWTELSPETKRIADFLIHQGRLYGVAAESDFVADLDLDDGGVPLLPRITTFMRPRRSTDYTNKDFLVETPDGGDLLRVVRHQKMNSWPENMVKFTVFELDKSRLEWVKVERLNGYVLFCGTHSCVAISTLRAPELRANSIYFDSRLLLISSRYYQSPGVRLFNMEDERVDMCFPPGHPLDELMLWPLIWVKPLLSKDRHVS